MAILDVWKKVVKSPAFIPNHYEIPPEQVDIGDKINTPFQPLQHYFIVRVNELYLSYKRKWVSTYDPVVFAVSEFQYGSSKITTPFLVGPSMLQSQHEKLPQGMIFKDTTVAGLHPYRGGSFSLSIVLGRLQQQNYLRDLMHFMESATGAFSTGLATAISSYVNIARIVLDGIDSLVSSNGMVPLIGYRQEFVPAVNEDFSTGYFVLINSDENALDRKKLFVRDNSLFYGDSMESSIPFRSDDYVLYSIRSATVRNDTETLPYHSQYVDLQRLVSNMTEINENEMKMINGRLFSVQDAVRMSPDLIRPQILTQIQDYRKEIRQMIDDRKPLNGAATHKALEKDDWDQEMDNIALEILDMKP